MKASVKNQFCVWEKHCETQVLFYLDFKNVIFKKNRLSLLQIPKEVPNYHQVKA